ncbi:MAG: pyridoxamine 5'-phosphate oxidase family protein [Desulfuromonadales bacterium]|nr:pyridoxamine 5'-phosphate oxidase family protein [Desulfuromonadales bacterium]
MEPDKEKSRILYDLCRDQPLAVLATTNGTAPYASLVAIAISEDLRCLYFATPRATRKVANLTGHHQVALLLDNRSNQVSDFSRAAAATLIGHATELQGSERERGLAIYLGRHPHLAGFTASPGTALYGVTVEQISLVTRFQQVIDYHLNP